MRIGINLLYLLPGIVGGTETYAAGLLHGLDRISTAEEEYIIFVNRESADWLLPENPKFKRVICPINGINRVKRYYYEQVNLKRLLQQYRISIIHSLGYVSPIRASCPSIVTIHDTNFVDLSRTIPLFRRYVFRYVSIQSARSAEYVITDSEFSKKRICRLIDIPSDKISVIHLAPRMDASEPSAGAWAELKKKYGITEPYIVAFGGGGVHKNIIRLIEAHKILNRKIKKSLVLIGSLPPDVDDKLRYYHGGMQSSIITTGYVPDCHIFPLISHAELFVVPSLYEGFGLPVLEAQQAGVAVACSTAGSLPEVGGNGALYFNPFSVEGIKEAMERILLDKEYQLVLRERGFQNRMKYSWEQTANKTREVYMNVLARLI